MRPGVPFTMASDMSTLIGGLSPDWGPFGGLGTTARIIIEVVMAGVVLFLLGTAIVGAVHIRVGNQQANTMETKKGQSMVASALVALFAVASMSAIFTIVYGMGLTG
jgi:hypothetical protein